MPDLVALRYLGPHPPVYRGYDPAVGVRRHITVPMGELIMVSREKRAQLLQDFPAAWLHLGDAPQISAPTDADNVIPAPVQPRRTKPANPRRTKRAKE